MLATCCAMLLGACGGGGNSGEASGAQAASAATSTSADAGTIPANGQAGSQANAPASASGSAVGAGVGTGIGTGAGAGVGVAVGVGSGPAANPTMAVAALRDFAYYRLGSSAQAGTATVNAGVLQIDGRQSSDVSLVAGACNAGTAFTQCAGTADANVFTLCGTDGGGGSGSDRIRGRYVLFDPGAQRITDASVLRNVSFSGFENCGQDNVGGQPKSAPSATLRFSANGDLTLVRYDRDPARSATLPSFLVDLNNDTVNGGQTARFNVYRSNGRYLIIATTAPTAGVTASEPGGMIAFVQN